LVIGWAQYSHKGPHKRDARETFKGISRCHSDGFENGRKSREPKNIVSFPVIGKDKEKPPKVTQLCQQLDFTAVRPIWNF
jgi:hypothetical protein